MTTLTSAQMFPEVQKRLTEKIPTAIIRYGDGETIMLNGFRDINSVKAVLKRQLGEVPSVDEIEQIMNNLKEAYTKADIIGIPTERHLKLGGYWQRSLKILKRTLGTELFESKIFTSIDFHSHFLDKKYYDVLLTDATNLNYISCRELDEQFKNKFNIKKVYSFIIAPERMFTEDYTGDKHFPTQFRKISRWVTKVPMEGTLFLYGAGFTGKVYGAWAKEQGAIAIDVGSMFDEWAGLVTRGEGKGINVTNDMHKL